MYLKYFFKVFDRTLVTTSIDIRLYNNTTTGPQNSQKNNYKIGLKIAVAVAGYFFRGG